MRELPDEDLALLPVFAAAHAAVWLVRLAPVSDWSASDRQAGWSASAGEPEWVGPLRAKLSAFADRQRAIVLAHAAARAPGHAATPPPGPD